jgi:hypothetical protein
MTPCNQHISGSNINTPSTIQFNIEIQLEGALIRGDEYLWEKAKLLNKKQWELIGRC